MRWVAINIDFSDNLERIIKTGELCSYYGEIKDRKHLIQAAKDVFENESETIIEIVNSTR